jgi:hypothetical protein
MIPPNKRHGNYMICSPDGQLRGKERPRHVV